MSDHLYPDASRHVAPLPVVTPPLVRDRYELALRSWVAGPPRPREEAVAELRGLVDEIAWASPPLEMTFEDGEEWVP